MTGKVRTYGLDRETLDKLINQIYGSLCELAEKTNLPNTKAPQLSHVLEEHKNETALILIQSITFTIGNFDRIPKVELEGELVDDKITKAAKVEEKVKYVA